MQDVGEYRGIKKTKSALKKTPPIINTIIPNQETIVCSTTYKAAMNATDIMARDIPSNGSAKSSDNRTSLRSSR